MQLSKYHGLGNDFLVAFDPTGGAGDLAPEVVRGLCDRRRGLGADGVIVGGPAPTRTIADLRMHLFNADGGRAEMSGNGIRCLAHAEARRRGMGSGTLRIATDAGLRTLELSPGPDAATATVAVDMGAARLGSAPDGPWPPDDLLELKRSAVVDLGNPHAVLWVDDPDAVDLARVGPVVEARFPEGVNVELIRPVEHGRGLDLRVWERGVGLTQACGTGACAAAHAAHRWGAAQAEVVVYMPGGAAVVEVGERLVLRGPSVHVADVCPDEELVRRWP